MGRRSRTPELEAARRRPGALTAGELRRAPEARSPCCRQIWSAHVLKTDLAGTVTVGVCTGRTTTGRTAPTTALRAWAAALEISAVRGSRPRDVPARTVSATPAPPADSGRTQRRSSVREVLWSHADPLCRSGDVYGPPTADARASPPSLDATAAARGLALVDSGPFHVQQHPMVCVCAAGEPGQKAGAAVSAEVRPTTRRPIFRLH